MGSLRSSPVEELKILLGPDLEAFVYDLSGEGSNWDLVDRYGLSIWNVRLARMNLPGLVRLVIRPKLRLVYGKVG